MKEGNVVVEKAFRFAVRVIRLSQHLTNDKKEFVLSKQVLRSGTSIGANLAEAEGGQSKADFIAKCQISYKEANETKYWLRLLQETNYLDPKLSESLLSDVQELIRILQAIIKTAKANLK
jgi:four helix bundle protein